MENIYLTGFMGSGKSTIGSILANVLGYHFIDHDVYIEAQQGISIPEIFAQYGESHFRTIEHETLCEISSRSDTLVALGGGALVQEQNLKLLKQKGLIVYLRVSASELAKRLQHAPNNRPLLQGEDGHVLPFEALRNRIADMLETRCPFYEQAHLTVHLDSLNMGQAVDVVANAIEKYRRTQRKTS